MVQECFWFGSPADLAAYLLDNPSVTLVGGPYTTEDDCLAECSAPSGSGEMASGSGIPPSGSGCPCATVPEILYCCIEGLHGCCYQITLYGDVSTQQYNGEQAATDECPAIDVFLECASYDGAPPSYFMTIEQGIYGSFNFDITTFSCDPFSFVGYYDGEETTIRVSEDEMSDCCSSSGAPSGSGSGTDCGCSLPDTLYACVDDPVSGYYNVELTYYSEFDEWALTGEPIEVVFGCLPTGGGGHEYVAAWIAEGGTEYTCTMSTTDCNTFTSADCSGGSITISTSAIDSCGGSSGSSGSSGGSGGSGGGLIPDTCGSCDASCPTCWTGTISGFTDGSCTCSSFNGTYSFEYVSNCVWSAGLIAGSDCLFGTEYYLIFGCTEDGVWMIAFSSSNDFSGTLHTVAEYTGDGFVCDGSNTLSFTGNLGFGCSTWATGGATVAPCGSGSGDIPDTCGSCDASAPTCWTATLSGFTDGDAECSVMNGTYTFEYVGASDGNCVWSAGLIDNALTACAFGQPMYLLWGYASAPDLWVIFFNSAEAYGGNLLYSIADPINCDGPNTLTTQGGLGGCCDGWGTTTCTISPC
jgi:hypothetical protein